MTGFVQKEIYDLNSSFKVEVDTSSSFPEGDPRVLMFQNSDLRKEAHAACAHVFMQVIRPNLLNSSKHGLTGPEILALNQILVSSFQELKASFQTEGKQVVLFFSQVEFDSTYDRTSGAIDLFAKYTVISKNNEIADLGAVDKLVTVKYSHRIPTRGTETLIDQFSSDVSGVTTHVRESLKDTSVNTFELSRDPTGSLAINDGYSIRSGVGSVQTK